MQTINKLVFNRRLIAALIALIAIFSVSVCLAPTQAQATPYKFKNGIAKIVDHMSAKKYTEPIKTGWDNHWDFNGDGVTDQFSVMFLDRSDDGYVDHYQIRFFKKSGLNNKPTSSVVESVFRGQRVTVSVFKFASGKPVLFVEAEGEAQSTSGFYSINKKNKITRLLYDDSLTKKGVRYTGFLCDNFKVNGNRLVAVWNLATTGIGEGTHIRCTYNYTGTKLKMVSKRADSISYPVKGKFKKGQTLTSLCKIALYNKAVPSKVKVGYMKKGAKVAITRAYVQDGVLWFYVSSLDGGTSGWMKNPAKTKNTSTNTPFAETHLYI